MNHLLLSFALVMSLHTYCQTREADYNYIVSFPTSAQADNTYRQKKLLESDFQKDNQVKVTLQFYQITTVADSKDRGIAIVYKEKRSNPQLQTTLALCIPAENSESAVTTKCQNAINDLNDVFVLKYILMGLISLGLKKL